MSESLSNSPVSPIANAPEDPAPALLPPLPPPASVPITRHANESVLLAALASSAAPEDHGTPSADVRMPLVSPAVVATAREGGSWVYMQTPSGSLDSIKRDLQLTATR
jgi:hypothetical protein